MVCRSCNKNISESAFMCPTCGEPYEIKQILSSHSQRLGLLSEALSIMLESQAFLLSASSRSGETSAQKLSQNLSDISSKLNKAQQTVIAPKLNDTSKIQLPPTVIAKPAMAKVAVKNEEALFEKPPTQKIVLGKAPQLNQPISPITERLPIKKVPLEGGSVASIKPASPKMVQSSPLVDDDIVTFEIEMSPIKDPKAEVKPAPKVAQPVLASAPAKKTDSAHNEEVDLFDL